MADIYELSLALHLREQLADEELAELRWHLGLGPRPKTLRIVSSFPVVVEDEHGEPVIVDDPVPLLGEQGEAWKVDGALVSVLVRCGDARHGAWALTVRQEIHPDAFDPTGELLAWLAGKADDRHRVRADTVQLGWTRFHESDRFEPLVVRDGEVEWP
ncbi:hypothetical protein [Streptomyces alanosinicus]|uniref:Uncharacterized protein n=1 Tax=Streptomyces alanosinicus TaxID=68171 RepID=A0A919D4W4_9ACTN|nr:hypothetical protein [Streptomyces alanosinicus]GHE08670.1 hypothetical protein GCM10010339_58340 [Streptomyces alanosinicus]